jgi:2-haloacid dehalogenase
VDLSGVRWLTFDCYGTLIDWERGILAVVRPLLPGAADADILARYAALEAEQERGKYRPYREVLQRVMVGLGHASGVSISPHQAEALPKSVKDWPAFDETPAALAVFQRRFKLAVISNVDDDLFAGTAPKLGVRLDGLITAQQCHSYKPSLNNFRVAMERLGAGPDQVLHIAESRYHDIAPARTLGIRSVWVNRARGRPSASGEAEAAPDMEVATLTELVERLG